MALQTPYMVINSDRIATPVFQFYGSNSGGRKVSREDRANSILSSGNVFASFQSENAINQLNRNTTGISAIFLYGKDDTDCCPLNSVYISRQPKPQNEYNSKYVEAYFKMAFLKQVKSSDFEYGELSSADRFLETFTENHEYPCFKWIYDLYCENSNDKEFIVGLLKTIAHMPSNKITSEYLAIAQKCLESESLDIKENAVRIFENWEYTDIIPILEKIDFGDPFLDNYLQGVIQDLKGLKKWG
jgi:hypothetical protein